MLLSSSSSSPSPPPPSSSSGLLLFLRLHFLLFHSFLDSAQALEREAGPTLRHYHVCDNIDLVTVLQVLGIEVVTLLPWQPSSSHLQEYESYYYIKFKKQPKLTRRLGGSGEECIVVSV